jgi:hypothetical protein
MPNEKELTVKIRVAENDRLTAKDMTNIVHQALKQRDVAGSIKTTTDTIARRTVKVRVERQVVDVATIEFSLDETDFQEMVEETEGDTRGFQTVEQRAVEAWMLYANGSPDFDVDTAVDKGENRQIIDWNWKIVEFVSGTDATGPVTEEK